MTVENLEIKVTTPGADKAAKDMLSLAGALDRVNKSASSVGSASKGIQRVGTAAKQATKHTNDFMSSLMRIAKYRLMRSIIKAITSAFTEGLENAYKFSDGIASEGHRFAAALDGMSTAGLTMKNQLGSAFISLLAAIAPIVNAIISLVIKLADALSQIFAAFTGGSYLKAINYNKKWADSAGGAAKAAKEWKNQLLSFDEINRLEEPNQGGGGGGGGSALDPSKMFEDTPLSDWAKKIKENLALIEMAAGGFLLALGLILVFTGANIPLGLGLIALGAASMAQALKEDWSSVDPKIASAVSRIMGIVGTAFLVLGAVLTFSGANIPLGIGFMLAGAAMLASAAAINWKTMPDTIGHVVGEILEIVGGALLVLGIIITLATPGFSALGLGLIVAGAAALAGGVALNWDNMPHSIREVVTKILLILGSALVVLGIILCLSGAGIPLGIGLLLAGAASFAGAQALNSSAIIQAVQEACNHIWEIVNGLFMGIHDWIQNIIDGICQFLSLSAINARADAAMADGSIYLQGFASGGFVPDGQLFLANEGSAPELVGQMGGRTAVANNDQIVEGIRQGVYDAVVAANNNGNSEIAVHVYLDSREIKSGQNRLSRSMGVA